MKQDITEYNKQCHECQLTKTYPLTLTDTAILPLEKISLDFMGKYTTTETALWVRSKSVKYITVLSLVVIYSFQIFMMG